MSKLAYITKKQQFKQWFPPHMRKGLVKIQENLRRIDCIIEVHDARIPFSGRNPSLSQPLNMRPRVIVLNKVDLIEVTEHQVKRIYERYHIEGVQKLLFTKCSPSTKQSKPIHDSIKKVIPACVDVVNNNNRYDRQCENEISIMVVGIPNVGKSSLLNDIRRYYLKSKPVCSVAPNPGHTKTVSFKTRVCDDPLVFLCDTPGIFKPKIENMEEGLKLAVCNTIHNHLMGAPMIAEFLLLSLNENIQHEYVSFFGLDQPTDCIRTVLRRIAKVRNFSGTRWIMTGTGKVPMQMPDYELSAAHFLEAYRKGNLGKFLLDKVV